MSVVSPSVTAPDAGAYREEMALVATFAQRVHIDFCDGIFAPIKLINLAQAYWPEGALADLHLMYQKPGDYLETAISLKPQTVIIQAEAEGDLVAMMRELHAVGLKAGVALLQNTQPDDAHKLIIEADHVLIFSGELGHFGGHADFDLLKKVPKIRAINPNAEICWDGGVTVGNANQIALGGVDVLVVGGAIQKADDPKATFEQISKAVFL